MSEALNSALEMARKYYAKEGNLCGGNLHIVLDDGNVGVDSVLFCRDRASDASDVDGVDLANELLTLTEDMRHELYCTLHGIRWYDREEDEEDEA